jgi:hypothetical protein
MTRLSAAATLAALLLLVTQGFSATKSTAKIATAGAAEAYHITAQNQFHFKSAKASEEARRTQIRTRETKPRRNTTANPPTGKIGFVSATQIPANGGGPLDVRLSAFGTSTGFITVVLDPVNNLWSYSVVFSNGNGKFTTTPALTPVPGAVTGTNGAPNFVVGDVNGDGIDDIVQADDPGTITVLLGSATGTFTPAPTGVGPASPFTILPAYDFTGGTLVKDAKTGFLDIVIVDAANPSHIITYAGNGDGTFGTGPAPIAAATSVALIPPGTESGSGYNVIITDYDGDGIVDVSENDKTTRELTVYLSSAKVPYTGTAVLNPKGVFGDSACSATAGSLTGSSGLPAIVEVNCFEDTITVYNNSAGVFSEGVYYPVAVTPTTTVQGFPLAATIADVNGDGNGDVTVVNRQSADVTILLGNGDGTLQLTSVGYATGGPGGFTGYPAIVTDINGDSFADILVADGEFSLTWMAGYGDGTFRAARDYYEPTLGSARTYGISIASGDFNGDGFVDIVESSCACGGGAIGAEGITVFLSNPDGSLQPGVNYGTGGSLQFVAVGDFNGDGKLDIAASDAIGVVRIFTGTGNGNFIEGPSYSTGGSTPQGIVTAKFGSDTAPDLAVVNQGNLSVTILTNDGSGGFTAGVPIAINAYAYELVATDLNGDGFPDLAIAEYLGSQVGVLLWDKATGLFDIPEADYSTLGQPYGITTANVTGNVDIIATVGIGGQGIALLSGNGDGTFNVPATVLASTLQDTTYDSPYPAEIQVADVDGDGNPDLIFTNTHYGTVGVLFGTGTGGATTPYFFDPVEFPSSGYAKGLTIADVNGDSAPDSVTADYDSAGGSTVLINGNGAGATPDYALMTNGSFLNITDGGTGTMVITLTPRNFYNGTVTFSCNNLPLDMTCSFAPATLTPAGNFALTSTLTVTTKAPSSSLHMPANANSHQGRTSLLACLTGMGLFGLLLAGDWKNKRNRRVGTLLGILVLGMMFSLVGCGSSTTLGTPVGAQSIQVIGTGTAGSNNGNSSAHTISVVINVF